MTNISSSPALTNVIFSGNAATIASGGGIRNEASSPTLTNVTFSGNLALSGSGGAMFTGSGGNPQVRNSILWGNSASQGAQIFDDGSTTTVVDSIVQGGYPGATDADPLFVAVADLRLSPGSPAIDAGDTAVCPATDWRGELRDDLGCDLGAYEVRFADTDTVLRPVGGTAVTTFGPTLAGIRNDGGADDPGVVTVVKSFTWATKPDNTIDAYWHITPGSGTNYNLTLQLCYLPAELNGLSEDNLRFWRYSIGGWTQVGAAPLAWETINGNRCAAVSGVTGFSDWTLGVEEAPTAVSLSSFSAASPVGWVGLLVGGLGAATAVLLYRRKKHCPLTMKSESQGTSMSRAALSNHDDGVNLLGNLPGL